MLLSAAVGCGEDNIFPPIPLTTDPLVLANPISMVASATSNRLYLVNSNNRVLWFDASFVIFDITDPVNPLPLAVISIANFGGQIILDEARGFVYIPDRQSSGTTDENDQILRINIDESSPDFLAVDLISSNSNPFGAFFDGNNLYVAATDEALRYNVNTFTGYTSVDLNVTTNEDRDIDAEETREIAMSPSGNTIFVTNRSDNMLILNSAEFIGPTASGETELGSEPVDYIVVGTTSTRGITRDSQFLYVVNGSPPALLIMTDEGLDPIAGPAMEILSSALQVASIPVGNDPGEVIVDEPNARAYVTNTGDDNVSVIDLNLGQEIARISVSTTDETEIEADDEFAGDQPFGMALVNLGGVNYLYVAHFQTNLVSVINADTLQLLNQFP